MLGIALRALEPLRGQHWILDGFPRTVNQAQLLDGALVKGGRGLNLIINLGVSDKTILSRIEGAARSTADALRGRLTRGSRSLGRPVRARPVGPGLQLDVQRSPPRGQGRRDGRGAREAA